MSDITFTNKNTGDTLAATEVNEIKTAVNSKQDKLSEGAFANGDKTKLDGIETGATADQTGAEIKSLYEAEANTNAYTDAEKSKLAAIEASADVTDATNVAAAGAVMNTGNETVAGVKTFSSFPVTPSSAPTTDYQTANKKYVDDSMAAAGAGDITGVTAGNGLSGGGDSGSVTLNLSTATASKSANYTVGTDNSDETYGGIIYVSGAATITLPAIAAGMNLTVITIGAVAVSVKPNASDRLILDGVALDDGDKATNTSTTGDILVCAYESAAGWYCASGSPDGDHWTDGGA